MKNLPNDTVLMPHVKSAVTERGLYTFPAMNEKGMSDAEMKKWADKVRVGSVGMLIVDPSGYEFNYPVLMGTEILSNILAALIAAMILARIPGTRMQRTCIAIDMGVLGWLSIDVSYWNWYRFSTGFSAASLIEQAGGWLLSGSVIALILGKSRVTGTAAS